MRKSEIFWKDISKWIAQARCSGICPYKGQGHKSVSSNLRTTSKESTAPLGKVHARIKNKFRHGGS